MFRYLNRTLVSDRGQTLLEFAFVAPVVLVFLLAIVDFGIAIDRRAVLEHAVREGGRYAAVGGNAFTTGVVATEADIKNITGGQSQGIADPLGMVGSDNYIEVCYEDANANGTLGDVGDNVRVRAHYVHDFVTGFTSFFNTPLASIEMNPSANARLERAVGGGTPC